MPYTYNDECYQDREEARDMENKDERFELWQYLAGVYVKKNGHSHDAPEYQCSLP